MDCSIGFAFFLFNLALSPSFLSLSLSSLGITTYIVLSLCLLVGAVSSCCFSYGSCLVSNSLLGRLPFSLLRRLFSPSSPILIHRGVLFCFATLLEVLLCLPLLPSVPCCHSFLSPFVVGGWFPSISLSASATWPSLLFLGHGLSCLGRPCASSAFGVLLWLSLAPLPLVLVSHSGFLLLFGHLHYGLRFFILFTLPYGLATVHSPLPLLAHGSYALFSLSSLWVSLSLLPCFSLGIFLGDLMCLLFGSYFLRLLSLSLQRSVWFRIASLPFSVSSVPFLGAWCSSLPLCSCLWHLVSSAGVSSPLSSPGSLGIFSLSFWPLLALLLFVLSLRFPSACYPILVIVGPISLLRCWLSSLGASLPGISLSCCDCRMVPPLPFSAASFRFYWPCPFFFGSTVSFCLALQYFFLISSFVGICLLPVFLLLPSVELLSPQFPCAIFLLLSVSWVPLLVFSFHSFLLCAWITCLLFLVGVFLFLVISPCTFFLAFLW